VYENVVLRKNLLQSLVMEKTMSAEAHHSWANLSKAVGVMVKNALISLV